MIPFRKFKLVATLEQFYKLITADSVNEKGYATLMEYQYKLDDSLRNAYIDIVAAVHNKPDELPEAVQSDKTAKYDNSSSFTRINKLESLVWVLHVFGFAVLMFMWLPIEINFSEFARAMSTLIAFFMVMLNFLIKETYRVNAIKVLKEEMESYRLH